VPSYPLYYTLPPVGLVGYAGNNVSVLKDLELTGSKHGDVSIANKETILEADILRAY
jgi:hypothetical protein